MKLATTILVFSVAALLSLGLVMLYSSSMSQSGTHYLLMQLIWGGVGLVACGIAASINYRLLERLALPLFGLAVAMLAAVLIVGVKINGARRWFDFGGVSFQPSEFAKLAVIVGLAWYGARYQRHMHTFWRGMALPGLFIGVVLGLIFVEPDRGTTILLAGVASAMLLVAGVRWRYFLPPLIAGVVALVISLAYDPMRARRILGWLYLEENKDGVGYQAWQAMLALGAGGVDGLGLGNGRQKLGFIPEHHTDFILPVIGEELGLIATLGVIAGFVLIVVCGTRIALRARENFGMLLATGVTFLIGMQAFINIGVVTSALPNKGLSLPFISYGGSNLLMMLACVGLLLSVARRAHVPPAASADNLEPGELSAPQPT